MGKGKRTSLKAALSSQQSRLKKKQDVTQALRVNHQKDKKNTQTKSSAPESLPMVPFSSTDKILLVGEGNFSFARALVENPPASIEFLPAENVIATAYDDEVDCYAKYPEANGIIAGLRRRGVQVVFGVDATKLEKCQALRGRRFDKIVWNFPHIGKGITDQDRNIRANQLLLLNFLRSASGFLTSGPIPKVHFGKGKAQQSNDEDENEDDSCGDEASMQVTSTRGRIVITLRNVPPYTLWDLPRLAKKPPSPLSSEPPNPVYMQLRSYKFNRSLWKGYEHRMTKGQRAHGTGKTGQGGEDRTWEFCLGSQRMRGQ